MHVNRHVPRHFGVTDVKCFGGDPGGSRRRRTSSVYRYSSSARKIGLLTSGRLIVLALLSFISPVSMARKYVHRMHSTLWAYTGSPSTARCHEHSANTHMRELKDGIPKRSMKKKKTDKTRLKPDKSKGTKERKQGTKEVRKKQGAYRQRLTISYVSNEGIRRDVAASGICTIGQTTSSNYHRR